MTCIRAFGGNRKFAVQIKKALKRVAPTGCKFIPSFTLPAAESKTKLLGVGMPHVDHIVDATQCEDAIAVGEKLVSALGRLHGLSGQRWF